MNRGKAELDLIERIRINEHLDLDLNVNYKVIIKVQPY